MSISKREAVDRLRDIQTELEELLFEATDIIDSVTREHGSMIFERAKSYWLAHAKMAISDDHGYLGGCDPNLPKTIQEIDEMNPF